MANELKVKFTGDTAELREEIVAARTVIASIPTATRIAKAGLQGFALEMANTQRAADAARVSQDALRTSTEAQTASVQAATAQVGILTTAYTALGDAAAYAFSKIAPDEHDLNGIKAIGEATAFSLKTVNTAFDMATGSVMNYFRSVAYGERGQRLFEQSNEGLAASIGRVIIAMDRFYDRLSLSVSGIAGVEIQAISAAGKLKDFNEAIDNEGGTAGQTLVGFTAQLMEIPGVTKEVAASIETMFATIPQYTVQTNAYLVDLVKNLATTSDEAVEMAKKIAQGFKDDNAGQVLGGIVGDRISQKFDTGGYKNSLKEIQENIADIQAEADRLGRSLSPEQNAKFLGEIITKLNSQVAQEKAINETEDQRKRTIPIIGGFYADISDRLTGVSEKQREFAAAVQIAVANLQKQKTVMDGIVTAQERQVQLEELLGDETTNVTKLAEAQKNIALLQTRAVPGNFEATDDASKLIKHFEGFKSTAYKDSDGAYRVGYGSDTTTDAGGGVHAVTSATTTTVDDANRDLARRIAEFSAEIATRVGPAFEKLSENAQASLTSVAYNYGTPRVPSSIINAAREAARTDDEDVLAAAIANQPSNPKRRAEEAANITQPDADDQAKVNQRLQEQLAIVKELNDKKAGGTVVDQAQLAITTENAYIGKDEVENARKLYEAKQQDEKNAQGTGPAAERIAAEATASAKMALDQAVTQVQIAEIDKRLGAVQKGSAEEMALNIQKAEAEQKQYQAGTAGYIQAQTRIQAAQKAFAATQTADAVSALTIQYDAKKVALDRETELIREQASTGQITGIEEVTQLREIYAQKSQLDRTYYQQKAILDRDTSQKVREDNQREQIAAQQSAIQLAKVNQQLALQVQQTWKEAMEGVSSSIASSLIAMQQRTGTFKDLMRNAVLSIEGYFLQAGLKMVADWAATQLQKLTMTAVTQTGILGLVSGGEAAQTAATAAGTAARTGMISSASVTQMAIQGAGMIKSILSSAAEAFAGIFGFLSPVLGPAAVVPAAAGQATVAGAASLVSFDVGSRDLPNDMVAQVHRGEMIIPASQAELIRRAMPSVDVNSIGSIFAQLGRGGGGGRGEGGGNAFARALRAGNLFSGYDPGIWARMTMPAFQGGAWSLPGSISRGSGGGRTVAGDFSLAGVLGSGQGGSRRSGGDTHFHISAVDGQSVKRLFDDHGQDLAKAVSKANRLSPRKK